MAQCVFERFERQRLGQVLTDLPGFDHSRFYDAIEMDFEVFAVNDEFIKQFGSFAQHSQERASLKELNGEFTDKTPDQGHHDILDNLFFRYQEKGLYVIGIRKTQGEHQRALPAQLETTS